MGQKHTNATCRCDSCMKCYQDAGLITYNIVRRDSTSVRSIVCLTEKGKQYLIERHIFPISPYYQCLAPKRATGSSTGGQRKADLEIHRTLRKSIIVRHNRKLKLLSLSIEDWVLPAKRTNRIACKLRADLNNKEYPMVTYIEMEL